MTKASLAYSAEFLAGCAMVASAQPCAVSAGLSEREPRCLIGPHPENLTMDLPCRIVLAAGQRPVEVHEGF